MAAFGYCLYLLWSGKILYGTMTLFLSQGAKLSSAFNALVRTVPSFLSASVSARRIRDLYALEPEPVLPDDGWTAWPPRASPWPWRTRATPMFPISRC